MHHFSDKTDNLKILGPNLPKHKFWGRFFGSNIVEGVAESSVEAEMSCVEVGGAGWKLK